MRVAILSSGGKDSAAAWWWAMCKGWDITHIVTVVVDGEDSHMFQIPGVEIVRHQAKLAGINYLEVHTEGIENEEIKDLQLALQKIDIDALVCGALRSDYQKSRIERMCQDLGVISYTPLWHQSPQEHLSGLVANGFGVMITSVACDGLDESWLGKILDEGSLSKLIDLSSKFRFNVDGEGGEYETLVVSGPHFEGKIKIDGMSQWSGTRGEFHITNITLV